MRLFPVLYIEAENNCLKTVSFPFSDFKTKIAKKGECRKALLWSFNLLSKLMRAANCVRFCLSILLVVR